MACNDTRTQCTASGVFAGVANPACGAFFDPGNFQAEQLVYDTSFKDLINSFGVPIDYYVDTFNLQEADLLYGEHTTRRYNGPHELKMYVELNENALNLANFGFNSEDDLTGYLHIQTFTDTISSLVDYSAFNQSIEPKSGDLIVMTALGCDRPNGRGAKWFEVTERVDQDIAEINPLLGHYVYRLRAKRYENSFELGLSGELVGEPANQQVYENSFTGIVSSNMENISASEDKSYTWDIDDQSQTQVLDMNINDTDIYGTYY